MTAAFPLHPMLHMQAPFEESMLDAMGGNGHVPFVSPKKSVKTRQQALCREEGAMESEWNFTYSSHWKRHPSGKYHPLQKIMTQIAFGVHLLHQHLERSVADVADILLKHVNELDGFLQQANEDLESSLKDMVFRHKCLKVPMEHVNEFDRLLEDRSYRDQLLDGNVVIERTIGRMSEMLHDYLIDVNTFQDANSQLDAYLLNIGDAWTNHNEDVGRIYSAMCGNTGGWSQFLQSLTVRAERLGVVLVQVSSYCNEIEKRCGAASRRSLLATRSSSRNSSNSRDNGRAFRHFASSKPLPTRPGERPPFLNSSANSSNVSSDIDSRHHPSHVTKADTHDQLETLKPTRYVAEQPKRNSSKSQSTVIVPSVNGGAHHQRNSTQPQYFHEAWHDEERRKLQRPATSLGESTRNSRLLRHRRKTLSNSAGGSREEKDSVSRRLSTKLDSPLHTGKDSAYSSVSGAQSPMLTSSRSASSLSARQNSQFALFPNGNLSTPSPGLAPPRAGALSPISNLPLRTVRSDVSPNMTRPSTSHSDWSDARSKRLSKRTSLTSLKKLFTKKQVKEIVPIYE